MNGATSIEQIMMAAMPFGITTNNQLFNSANKFDNSSQQQQPTSIASATASTPAATAAAAAAAAQLQLFETLAKPGLLSSLFPPPPPIDNNNNHNNQTKQVEIAQLLRTFGTHSNVNIKSQSQSIRQPSQQQQQGHSQRKRRRLIGNLDNTLDGLVAKRADQMPLKRRYQTETEAIELPDDELEIRRMEADPDVCTRMCSVCGYQGKWVSEMIRHKRVHTNDRPFKCKYCNRTSKWKADLIRHVAKTHGIRVVSKYSRSKAFEMGKQRQHPHRQQQQQQHNLHHNQQNPIITATFDDVIVLDAENGSNGEQRGGTSTTGSSDNGHSSSSQDENNNNNMLTMEEDDDVDVDEGEEQVDYAENAAALHDGTDGAEEEEEGGKEQQELGMRAKKNSDSSFASLNSMFCKAQRLNKIKRNNDSIGNNQQLQRGDSSSRHLSFSSSTASTPPTLSSAVLNNLMAGITQQQQISMDALNNLNNARKQQTMPMLNGGGEPQQQKMSYKCGFCIFEQSAFPLLVAHQRTAHNISPFVCQICNHSFNELISIGEHFGIGKCPTVALKANFVVQSSPNEMVRKQTTNPFAVGNHQNFVGTTNLPPCPIATGTFMPKSAFPTQLVNPSAFAAATATIGGLLPPALFQSQTPVAGGGMPSLFGIVGTNKATNMRMPTSIGALSQACCSPASVLSTVPSHGSLHSLVSNGNVDKMQPINTGREGLADCAEKKSNSSTTLPFNITTNTASTIDNNNNGISSSSFAVNIGNSTGVTFTNASSPIEAATANRLAQNVMNLKFKLDEQNDKEEEEQEQQQLDVEAVQQEEQQQKMMPTDQFLLNAIQQIGGDDFGINIRMPFKMPMFNSLPQQQHESPPVVPIAAFNQFLAELQRRTTNSNNSMAPSAGNSAISMLQSTLLH